MSFDMVFLLEMSVVPQGESLLANSIDTVPHPQIKFFKISTQTPHPPKNYKNFQGTMSNVGQHYIKKCPEPFEPGQKMATETIKEKQ
jgi:hypothetical protein